MSCVSSSFAQVMWKFWLSVSLLHLGRYCSVSAHVGRVRKTLPYEASPGQPCLFTPTVSPIYKTATVLALVPALASDLITSLMLSRAGLLFPALTILPPQ
jgi:hypothetical protein